MQKLKLISDILVNWIQDFFTHRKQKVVLKGPSYSKLEATSRVPQGSVLSPTLLLIYINNL